MADLFAFDDVHVVGSDGSDILRGVTATIRAEGITCVLGPSGAGKSTLLRLCNRLDVPTTGSIRFRGEQLADADPLRLRRSVGMVFQRPTPFEGSVADNLEVASPGADRATMVSALGRAELDASFLDRDARRLSGGEAQRVCLARTLITAPEALLMDEPTSALDPASRTGLEGLARLLAGDGMPIVWVTHDLAQARRLAERVLVMVDGRVAVAGTFDDVEASPDRAVRDYLAGDRDGP